VEREVLRSLTDEELELYQEYRDNVLIGVDQTPDQSVVLDRYRHALEAECRAAGFRSVKERLWVSEIERISLER
jgi:hypothetical protein